MAKQDTIKFLNEKIAANGDASDYAHTPLGVDSENIDRPDGRTGEETFTDLLNGVNLGKSLKYEDPFLYLLDGNGVTLSRITLVLPSHKHEYTVTITKEATYTEPGMKTYTCACGDSYTEEIPMLVDSISPSGLLKIGTKTYNTLLENTTFNTYLKDPQEVTIEASDNETGIKSISYCLSNSAVDTSGLASLVWVDYTGAFTIQPNNQYIVYVRIMDNADNITYLCSDGIVLDNIAPVFDGMEDGGTYPTGTVLTVQDGETLYVNGVAVELTDNSYTFDVEDNYLLSINDRAGNNCEISITIQHVHNYVDGVCSCGKRKYEDFELNSTNMYMAGVAPNGDVIIPETFEYNGEKYKVTSIGINAFNEANELTSVSIPDSVTKIGEAAFYGCSALTSLTLSHNILTIDSWAFACCTSLSTVKFNLPTRLKVLYDIFAGCTSLNNIIIPDGINSLYGTFNGCTSLRDIVIPDTLTIIGDYTFYNCEKLQMFDLSSKPITYVGECAFCNCTSLTTLKLPCTATFVGERAFANCLSMTTLTLPGENTNSSNNHVLRNCTALKIINIAVGSTKISDDLLSDYNTFYACEDLTEDNPIPELAFTTINIPDGVTEIGSFAFYDLRTLTTINVPDSLSIIGMFAFHSCMSLTDIQFPKNIRIIGESAFCKTKLSNLNIPRNEGMILGSCAFRNCTSLETATIPGDYLIDTSKQYDLNNGRDPFEGCTALKTINIVEGSSKVFSEICSGVKSLETINLPESIRTIDDHAFFSCESLKSINIPDGVTEILSIFGFCTSLTELHLPNSITSIKEDAFYETALETITIPGNFNIISDDSYASSPLWNKGSYKSTIKKINITDGSTIIGNNIFHYCKFLTTVNIPNCVETIETEAFFFDQALVVTIPDSVKNIGNNAFYHVPHIYYNGTASGAPWEALAMN